MKASPLAPNDLRHGTIHGYSTHRCRYTPCQDAASERTRHRREEFKALLAEAKDQPCADCGIRYPIVCMDFDHRDPLAKSLTIASAASRSREAIRTEIAKCDVVCANCHRLRTAVQLSQGTIKSGRPRISTP